MESQKKIKEMLKQIQKEYEKKQRKLKKHNRAVRAKEHVKKTLREQASLQATVNKSNNNNVEYKLKSACPSNTDLKHAESSDEKRKLHRSSDVSINSTAESQQCSVAENRECLEENLRQTSTETEPNETDLSVTGKWQESASLNSHLIDGNNDQNSCSQDIFSSPKPNRNLFEDIQNALYSQTDVNRSPDRHAKSDFKRKDCIVDAHRQAKENQNKENLFRGVAHNSDKGNVCQSLDNHSQVINSSSDGLDNTKKSKNNRTLTEEDKKGTGLGGKKAEHETTADMSLDVYACLSRTETAPKKDTVGEPISALNVLNNHLGQEMLVESQKKVEINDILPENQIKDNQIMFSLSETPSDSDGTIPNSLEDFVSDKSCSRKRTNSAKRRQSLRIAELSSQGSSQSNSDSILSEFSSPMQIQISKDKEKMFVISSIFQCLVDEAKREKSAVEFSLPSNISQELGPNISSSQEEVPDRASESPSESSTGRDIQCSETQKDAYGVEKMPDQETVLEKGAQTVNERIKAIVTALPAVNDETQRVVETSEKFSNAVVADHVFSKYSPNLDCKPTVTETLHKNKDQTEVSPSDIHATYDEGKEIPIPMSKTSQDECLSPPLFDSQNVANIEANIEEKNTEQKEGDRDSDFYSSPKESIKEINLACRASPAGNAVQPEDPEESDQHGGMVLEQRYIFQVPRSDQLIALIMGEKDGKLHIVCLCSANLRFYCLQDDDWSCYHTEKLGFSVKKNSGCSLTLIPDTSRLCVILQQRKTDSVKLILYTSSNFVVGSYNVDCLWSRSVLLCPTTQGEFIASHTTDQKTFLTKYTVNKTSDNKQRQNLDHVLDEIIFLCSVKDEEALLGLSVTSQLFIWNYRQMSLLTTVDLSDVALPDMMCSHAFYEEGFLFLVVLSRRKCQQAGSVLVVNPQIGTCETLTALESKNNKWTGVTTAALLHDEYIVSRESCGSVLIWDIYTGKLASSLKDTNVSCVTASSLNVAIGHKQCVHVYKAVDSGVDDDLLV